VIAGAEADGCPAKRARRDTVSRPPSTGDDLRDFRSAGNPPMYGEHA
jgi:hypothetical protein